MLKTHKDAFFATYSGLEKKLSYRCPCHVISLFKEHFMQRSEKNVFIFILERSETSSLMLYLLSGQLQCQSISHSSGLFSNLYPLRARKVQKQYLKIYSRHLKRGKSDPFQVFGLYGILGLWGFDHSFGGLNFSGNECENTPAELSKSSVLASHKTDFIRASGEDVECADVEEKL